MGAPILGIGQAFGKVVAGERESQTFRDTAAQASEMFRRIGTPESNQFAELFIQNPRAAFAMGQQVGGLKNLLAMSQAQAARARLTAATQTGDPGSPEQLRAIGGAAVGEGEIGAGINAYIQAAQPDASAKAPITREFKVGDKIVTRQFDPETRKWTDLESGPRFAPRQSEEFTIDPATGAVTYRKGGASTTATQTSLEKQLSDSSNLLARLGEVRAAYEPEFQQLPFRASQTLAAWGEKLGRDPTAEEQKSLERFSEFRAVSIDTISRYLNSLSGAAITPEEYKRLTSALPNAGFGLFDGDAPTVFSSKLSAIERQGKLSMLRLSYEKRHGLGVGASGFSLYDRKGLLKATAQDRESELVAQGASAEQARARAAQEIAKLNAELGG